VVINGFSLVSTIMPYFFVTLGLLAALRGTERDGAGAQRNEFASQEIQKG
jgi:predicted ABC-type sugar transport system permease subunit